jgi:hypothetical protein
MRSRVPAESVSTATLSAGTVAADRIVGQRGRRPAAGEAHQAAGSQRRISWRRMSLNGPRYSKSTFMTGSSRQELAL